MFDDVKVARELYVGYSGIHGAEAAIFQPQRLFAVDQLFFTWPQFRRKTRKPCLVVLLTKAMPSLLLTLAPPPRYVEMEQRLKSLAVKWTLYFRRNLLLDGEPKEGRLVRREADALGRNPRLHSSGQL
jgi:hypothetical protein